MIFLYTFKSQESPLAGKIILAGIALKLSLYGIPGKIILAGIVGIGVITIVYASFSIKSCPFPIGY